MLGLAGILLLGVGAQWLAWRLRIPSILLLLLAGFAIGPATGQRLLDPDALLGEALQPFVSLAVAVVLFEGGLSLRVRELRGAGRAVLGLVLLGPVITLALVTLCAHSVLGFQWGPALLVGAILVVTGPTVIGPLLRHVRPVGSVGRIVRWEGIVTDPIGAILAVLVFQAFLHEAEPARGIALVGLSKAIVAGGACGAVGGLGVVQMLRRRWIPDFLHAPVTLAVALACFVAADHVQHESGLLAVTLMGMWLANQRRVVVEHIVEFKENLRVLLVSMLFILLAARVPASEFERVDLRSVGFVLLVIFAVRPAMVFLATPMSGLGWRERLFLSWMAPRGIVAAAVASVFALEMDAERFPEAARLVPVIFLVILMTVAVYGLTAAPVARWLGLSRGVSQGVLFVGAHAWARQLALALQGADVEVLLVDTNYGEVQAARIAGLPAHYGSVVAEDLMHVSAMDGIGQLLALTHNDHVNALACLQFGPSLGRDRVFQLAGEDGGASDPSLPAHLRGRPLFDTELGYWDLEARFRAGATVKRTRLSEEFTLADFHAAHDREGAPAVPLFRVGRDGVVEPFLAEEEVRTEEGDALVALVSSEE